jgi:hypothetical protein
MLELLLENINTCLIFEDWTEIIAGRTGGFLIMPYITMLIGNRFEIERENFCQNSKKIWMKLFKTYLCTPNKKGSIAQLVQSICLTSRGSAVRSRVLPQTERVSYN